MIADYNEALKGAQLYPQATWRKIQHLTDLRYRCAHVLNLEPGACQDPRRVDGGLTAAGG